MHLTEQSGKVKAGTVAAEELEAAGAPAIEPEVTPEMIEAGFAEYCSNEFVQATEETIKNIFLAMFAVMAKRRDRKEG